MRWIMTIRCESRMLTVLATPFIKKTANLLRHLLWASLWSYGVSLLLGYALRWWPGERFFAVRMLNYFMPWLLAGLIPGLLLAILVRRYWLSMVLAIPALCISVTFAPLFWPPTSIALAANTPLKVMSFNIWGYNQDIEAAAQLIGQEQADIVLLQEIYGHIGYKLFDALSHLYPDNRWHLVYEPDIGQAIVSRYPLTETEVSPRKGRMQKVVVKTPNGLISVWNVHTTAPAAWSRQYRQVAALAEDIAHTNGPLLVGGDFNTTDQAEAYQMINQHLKNAHWQAGWGFGFTFPAHAPRFKGVPILTPMVRIDHIFYSQHFRVRQARTLSISGGSDHFPIVAELLLVE